MRRVGDYMDEMGPLAISDSDIERILRGQAPHGPGLSRLVSMVEELRALQNRPLRPEIISRHVSMAADAVRDSLVEQASVPSTPASAPRSKSPRWSLIPRLGTAVATFALLIGMTGVAVAADAAIPGEALHGLDLALEKIGVGAGGAEERIAEAKEMAVGGMPVEALDHVSSALGTEQAAASNALKAAAGRLRTQAGERGSTTAQNAEVAAMLEWMATADLHGNDFGLSVAEWAQGLGNAGPGAPETVGETNAQNDKGNAKPGGAGKDRGRRGR